MPRFMLVEEMQRRMAAYREARSDAEAARILGLHQTTFAHWRRSKGLPAKYAHTNKEIRGMRARMEELWPEVSSDLDLARRLGIGLHRVISWRRHNGIPTKNPQKPYSMDALVEAHLATDTDAEASRLLGCHPCTVLVWRHQHGIPARNGSPRTNVTRSEKDRRRWHAYCLTHTAQEAAKLLDVTESSQLAWIRRMGLPSYPQSREKRRIVVDAAKRGDALAMDGARKRRWM